MSRKIALSSSCPPTERGSEMIDIRHLIPSAYTGRFTIDDISLVEYIALHHTMSHTNWNTWVQATQEQEIQHLLDIDAMHRAWGLGGFGYHNAAFASGRAYRLSDYNLGRAHVRRMNHRAIGTVLIGNFTNAVPLPSHLAAARECIADIRRRYHEFLGAGAPKLIVEAHRNIRLQNTTCPGGTWEEWGPTLKEDDMDDERVREIVKELLGYRPDAGNKGVREDMAKMRVQALSVMRIVGLALAGTEESWQEARQIMDFYGWGK